MIVFGNDCKFFIVLPIRLKTCRSNDFFLFYKAKCLRGFALPSNPDRHRARNSSRSLLVRTTIIFANAQELQNLLVNSK